MRERSDTCSHGQSRCDVSLMANPIPFQKRPYFGGFFQQQLRQNLGLLAFKDSITQSDIHPNVPIVLGPLPFVNLPPSASAAGRQLAVITDSNTNTWGANVAGGGSFTVLAWWNGTNWTVIGK